MSDKIIDIDALKPHVTLEVICIKCYYRYMAVGPLETLLKDYHCIKCGPGFVISTGEEYLISSRMYLQEGGTLDPPPKTG